MNSPGNSDCPACGSFHWVSRGEKNGFSMLSCKGCGTLYTSNLPDEEHAHNYDDYYTIKNLSAPDFVHERLDQVVTGFNPYRKTNRLLDVGCGAGSMLQAAVRSQWMAEGLEISPPAVAHLTELGLNVRCQFLEEAGYPDNHFDVVTACGVLEHVARAESFTAEIARILRPGGLLYATTPNGAGGSARLLGLKWSIVAPPEHLHLFSVKGMKMFLTRCRLEPLRVFSEGTNPYEIIHVWRNYGKGDETNGSFDRVTAAYALNESFTRSRSRRLAKDLVNKLLSISRLGDELKIYAKK